MYPLPIYLDYQASTPLDPRVLEAMMPFLTGNFGNPHAAEHAYGRAADAAISRARGSIAALIGAEEDEIVFTSGATESCNIALLGAALAAGADRPAIVVSAIEHKCVLACADRLRQEGHEAHRIGARATGVIDTDQLPTISDRTAIASVMAINNETGAAQPLARVSEACRAAGALFHSDAAQALTAGPLDVDALGVDLLSVSSHKAYGPKGVGALYVRREARDRIRPIMHGGGQEEGLRPGTLPTVMCVGFGEACRILAAERESDNARIRALRDRLLEGLRAASSVALNGTLDGRHPGNLNVRFHGAPADLLLATAEGRVAAASGSACSSGVPGPSHVLTAMGLGPDEALESIRISLGRFTTASEIDQAIEALAEAAATAAAAAR